MVLKNLLREPGSHQVDVSQNKIAKKSLAAENYSDTTSQASRSVRTRSDANASLATTDKCPSPAEKRRNASRKQYSPT